MNPSALNQRSLTKALANIGVLVFRIISVCDLDTNRLAVYVACVECGVLEIEGLVDCAVVVDKEVNGDAALI